MAPAGVCTCGTLNVRQAPRAVAIQGRPAATPVLRSSFLGAESSGRSAGRLLQCGALTMPSQRRRIVTSMAAKVTGLIKLALQAGKANPAPPVGPALGAKGVNIMQFCKEYNAATQDKIGTVIPVEITVYEDRSFTFILKTPPASVLLAKAAGVPKGSGNPKVVVGQVTRTQLREIAELKLPDLNAFAVEPAMKVIEGTAKNMGIQIVD